MIRRLFVGGLLALFLGGRGGVAGGRAGLPAYFVFLVAGLDDAALHEFVRVEIGQRSASGDDIAASAKPAKVGGIESQRFVMASNDGKKGLDAVMTPHKGATWFFKMSGDAAAVAANGAALVAFLAESQLP